MAQYGIFENGSSVSALWDHLSYVSNLPLTANASIHMGIKMEKILIISAGAILGANARYWLGDWAAQKWGTGFPLGTLAINLSGSLLLGFFMTLATERFLIDPRWRLFFAVGFLGAYTTFSTYTYESFNLLFKGQWLAGLINLLGSAILGIAAVGLGIWIGKLM
jgi:fluoride exporter